MNVESALKTYCTEIHSALPAHLQAITTRAEIEASLGAHFLNGYFSAVKEHAPELLAGSVQEDINDGTASDTDTSKADA